MAQEYQCPASGRSAEHATFDLQAGWAPTQGRSDPPWTMWHSLGTCSLRKSQVTRSWETLDKEGPLGHHPVGRAGCRGALRTIGLWQHSEPLPGTQQGWTALQETWPEMTDCASRGFSTAAAIAQSALDPKDSVGWLPLPTCSHVRVLTGRVRKGHQDLNLLCFTNYLWGRTGKASEPRSTERSPKTHFSLGYNLRQ